MSATTYSSFNFHDPDIIVADLTPEGAQSHSGASLGFLFCDSQIDAGAVLAKLSATLDFPVVGGTAMAFSIAGNGGDDISASLVVLRKSGLRFSLTVSERLNADLHQEQMRAVYDRCLETLGADPKLIMPFFPFWPGLPANAFINDILSLAGSTPVFGGITTNDFISTKAAVFADGKAHVDRMALVMLSGDIEPAFSTSNKVSPMVDYAPIVTSVENNEIFRVDEQNFCDYMRSIGIKPEQRVNGVDALMQYGPTPVLVQHPAQLESDVPEVRCISYTNLEKGSAVLSASVPEGAKIRMSILRQQDVIDSAKECLEKLSFRMRPAQEKGYEYSALFCMSCVARYFAFVGDSNREREILSENPPAGLAGVGVYVFCEIGPVCVRTDNCFHNYIHSASIIMCAI